MGDAMIRGLAELAAVKVLSGAVGSTVMSASTSDQEALEGQDGHGLFTWVLLRGLNGSADFRNDRACGKGQRTPNLHNAGQSFQIVSSRQ